MFSVIGGHWGVLQTVAWTGMMIENVQVSPLTVAIRETFSGEKPCHLCHIVQEGREQEQHLPTALAADKKSDKFLKFALCSINPPSPCDFSYPPISDCRPPSRPLDPPFHVPIAA